MPHVLRYHIRECMAENRLSEILTFCQRTGCSEVLLFTGSYDFQPSFVPLEELQSYAKKLEEWGKTLAAEGIKVNINLLQTLGHINFPRSLSAEFPFQRRVSWTGSEDVGGACPLDDNLRKYVAEAYCIFASLKPELIYVDDDFRSLIGGMCCFCERHMERVGQLLGKRIGRDELVSEMLNTHAIEPNAYRMAFHKAQVDGLIEMAEIIRHAVDQVSPDIQLGLMVAIAPKALWGHDFGEVARTLAGNRHRPLLRPQMQPYSENNDLRICAGSFRQPAIVRELYNHSVDVQPEIENYTYTTYSKSSQLTLLQMTTAHMDGCHDQLLNIFDFYGSPLAESESIVKMLEENRGLFEQLTEIIPEGTRSVGVAMWQHPRGHLYHRPRTSKINQMEMLLPNRSAEQYISLLGIPVGFDWRDSPFLALFGDDVAALDKESLKVMLERNAILDLPAIERIIEKGLGDMIGVNVGAPIARDQSTAEFFVNEAFCGEHTGRYSPLRIFTSDGWCRELSGDILPISVIVDSTGQHICPAIAAARTIEGRHFGILPFAVDDMFRQMFVTARHSFVFRRLLEWVANRKLPVVVTNHAFLVPQLIKAADDSKIFSLSNYSLDSAVKACVEMDNQSLCGIKRLTSSGQWVDAESEFELLSKGKLLLKRPIPAFSAAIYRTYQ